MLEVLNFGAGVQSTTLLLMSIQGILPRLDAAIFADTQAEPKVVYEHLQWCEDQAASAGIKVVRVTAGNLREDLISFWGQRKSADGKRYASIPAFVKTPAECTTDGSGLFDADWMEFANIGMVRRQCTGTYKIDVIEQYVRQLLGLEKGQRWPQEPSVRQWLGISYDERSRSKRSARPAVTFWHPLIEAECLQSVKPGQLFPSGMTRDDCKAWLVRHGYKIPPRSACTFCPFRTDEEWVDLRDNHPDDFADAVEVDRLIRERETERKQREKISGLVGQPYLHRSCVPLPQVQFRPGASDKAMAWEGECGAICNT